MAVELVKDPADRGYPWDLSWLGLLFLMFGTLVFPAFVLFPLIRELSGFGILSAVLGMTGLGGFWAIAYVGSKRIGDRLEESLDLPRLTIAPSGDGVSFIVEAEFDPRRIRGVDLVGVRTISIEDMGFTNEIDNHFATYRLRRVEIDPAERPTYLKRVEIDAAARSAYRLQRVEIDPAERSAYWLVVPTERGGRWYLHLKLRQGWWRYSRVYYLGHALRDIRNSAGHM